MENKNTIDILEELDFDNTPILKEESDIVTEIIEDSLTQDNIESIVFSNHENNNDILSQFELDEDITEKKDKKGILSNIMGVISFIFKYTITTSLIFLVLLFSTNYSAYIQLAESYLYPERLEQSKASLYSSLSSNNISNQRVIKKDDKKMEETEKENNEKLNKNLRNNIGSSISNENINFHSVESLSSSINNNINLNINIAPYENRVIVPRIGKNIPLIDVDNRKVRNVGELEDIFMTELVNGVVRYPGSAKPGEIGNSFIFGHSSNFPWLEGDYNDVFALLDHVVFGDDVIIYYEQKKYTYKIREKKVVRPGDTSILRRDNGKAEVTLMTCWPVGTTLNRMIVTGELVETN